MAEGRRHGCDTRKVKHDVGFCAMVQVEGLASAATSRLEMDAKWTFLKRTQHRTPPQVYKSHYALTAKVEQAVWKFIRAWREEVGT